MKHLLLTTIAAVVLVGCGPSEADRALFKAVAGVEPGDTSVQLGGREHEERNIEAVKQHLAAGADVNTKDVDGETPVDFAEEVKDWHAPEDKASKKQTADLLRKHGAKTRKELKAEGK